MCQVMKQESNGQERQDEEEMPSLMLFHECEYVNMMCACVKKRSLVILQYVHNCVPTYCPYWNVARWKARNSWSAIQVQEDWNNSPTHLSKRYNKMCSACKVAQTLAEEQTLRQ